MSSFLLKKKAYAGSFAFLFQFEEIDCRIASNACGGLWRQCFIGNNVQRFRRFNDNFDLNDKKRENRSRKVEDCQLQDLLDEDDTQSQKMLAEQLGVSQVVISMQLHTMRKVQRSENELNNRQSDDKTHAKFCLPDKKENRSCVGL